MSSINKVWVCGLALVAMTVGCGKKDKSDGTSTDSTATGGTVASAGGGAAPTTTTSADLTSAASANIATVGTNMVPGSLAITTSLDLDDSNPCAGTTGLFGCQPNLLKVYLGMAQSMLTNTQQMVDQVGQHLGQLTLPAKGSVPGDAGSGVTTVDYNATSLTSYEILVNTDAGSFLDIAVEGSQYTIKADMSKAPDGGGTGTFESIVNYTDDANFSVNVTLAGNPCQAQQLGAPETISTNVVVTNGVWQGKAMLYQPRWMAPQGADCSFVPTAASTSFIYTDFVGDKSTSTISLYLIPGSATKITAFDGYAGADFCTNFPSVCTNGQVKIDTAPVDTYTNPACISESAATTWGAACTSTNLEISKPTYGDPSLWIQPQDLQAFTVTVPAALK